MTLLIATRYGIWADRRVTGGSTRFRPEIKIVSGDGIVAGFCGEQSACVKALRAVRNGETDAHTLAEKCEGLVVSESGTIWELWNKLAQAVPRRESFAAHGSGHAEARAFLFGAGCTKPRTVARAFRYVAKVRVDCGDGYNFRGFK